MGQQDRRILKPPTDEELNNLPRMEGFNIEVPPPTDPNAARLGIQGTPFGKKVGNIAYGLGVTPSQMGQNVSGLLQMFQQSPLKTADQALGLVTDPINRVRNDPQVRQGLLRVIRKNFDPTAPLSFTNEELKGLEGFPGIGNQFVEPNARIAAGDVEGGRDQALGAALQAPVAALGPRTATNVAQRVTNIPRYGLGEIPRSLGLSNQRGGGGTNRMGRLALDFGPDVPLEVAREGTDAVLDHGLMRFGINAGQDRAKVLAERANQAAVAASGPGTRSVNLNPFASGQRVYGPNPPNPTINPLSSTNVDELLASSRTQPEQLGYMQEQLTRLHADAPRRGFTPEARIPFAENARFGQRDLGESATIDMRRAFAADEREAIRQAAPATTPHLATLERLDPAQRTLSLARPKPYTGSAMQAFGGLRFPAIQTLDDLLVRAPRAATKSMGELVRLAILAQMAGPENPER